jgi:hypothetical protein
MAIIKPAVKLILREARHYNFSGPVLTLGVPEIYATPSECINWFPALTGQYCDVPLAEMGLSTNETGQKLGWISASTFFRLLRLKDVVSVDILGCEHVPDLVHDLNQPFPSQLLNRFGMIIDPGTIEHVFDMKTCLSNLVRALKVGGVVIHQVPNYSYNGGYFSINPNVLHDFYRANGFSDLKAYLILWDRYHAYTGEHLCYEYSDSVMGARNALASSDLCRYQPMILFFARKTTELSEIVVPLQHENHYAFRDEVLSSSSPSVHLGQTLNEILNRIPFPLAHSIRTRLKRMRMRMRSSNLAFRI